MENAIKTIEGDARKIKLATYTAAIFAAVFLCFAAAPAFAATGNLTCSTTEANPPYNVTCSGNGWSGYTAVTVTYSEINECGTTLGSCTTDGDGNIIGASCNETLGTLSGGTWYLYGTEDSCVTSAASSTNPIIVEGEPEPSMLAGMIGSLLDNIGTFATQITLILLAALGIALAIYGVRYGWGLFQTFVRVKRK